MVRPQVQAARGVGEYRAGAGADAQQGARAAARGERGPGGGSPECPRGGGRGPRGAGRAGLLVRDEPGVLVVDCLA